MRIITRHEHFMPANKFSGIYVLQDFVSPMFAGFRFSNVSCQADIRNPLRCLIWLKAFLLQIYRNIMVNLLFINLIQYLMTHTRI